MEALHLTLRVQYIQALALVAEADLVLLVCLIQQVLVVPVEMGPLHLFLARQLLMLVVVAVVADQLGELPGAVAQEREVVGQMLTVVLLPLTQEVEEVAVAAGTLLADQVAPAS